jgi:hypothetical protein
LLAGDRGRHRGADLVIINGVGDRYDALLAALAVAQVGGVRSKTAPVSRGEAPNAG